MSLLDKLDSNKLHNWLKGEVSEATYLKILITVGVILVPVNIVAWAYFHRFLHWLGGVLP
jgi:hypothetical protein